MGESMAIPTGRDKYASSIYATNCILRQEVTRFMSEVLPKVEFTVVDEEWKSDELLLQPQQKEVLNKKYTTRFKSANDCSAISCYPRDISGNICTPQTNTQTWRSIAQQAEDVFTSCQMGCYNVNVKANISSTNPEPSFGDTVWKTDKCYFDNMFTKHFALFPSTRDTKSNPGITDAPPFEYVTIDKRENDEDMLRTSRLYCDFFGLDYISNGANSRCDSSTTAKGLELLFGTYVSRYLTRGPTIVKARNVGNYRVMVSQTKGYTSACKVFSNYTKLENGADSQLRQVLVQHYPEYRQNVFERKNSRRLIEEPKDAAHYVAQYVSGIEEWRRVADQTAKADDKDNTYVHSLTGGGMVADIVASIAADIGLEVSLVQIKKGAKKIISKLSGSAGVTVVKTLSELGGRNMVKAVVQSSVMKLIPNLTLSTSAKAIGIGIARLVVLGASVLGWITTIVGIAGVVLDLWDPQNLNKEFTQQYITTMVDNFINAYHQSFRINGSELVEITPSALFELNQMNVSDLKNGQSDTAEDDPSPELISLGMQESSKFLFTLTTNSYGQALDWSKDFKDDTVKPLTAKERALALNSVDEVSSTAYNARMKQVFYQDSKSQYSTLAMVFMITCAASATCAALCLVLKSKIAAIVALILFAAAIITLVLWYNAKRKFIENTNIFKTAFNATAQAIVKKYGISKDQSVILRDLSAAETMLEDVLRKVV